MIENCWSGSRQQNTLICMCIQVQMPISDGVTHLNQCNKSFYSLAEFLPTSLKQNNTQKRINRFRCGCLLKAAILVNKSLEVQFSPVALPPSDCPSQPILWLSQFFVIPERSRAPCCERSRLFPELIQFRIFSQNVPKHHAQVASSCGRVCDVAVWCLLAEDPGKAQSSLST